MQINRSLLNRRVASFLRSPDASPIFDAFDMPLLARLIEDAVKV